ncbi:MAG: hypothetical protein ACYDG5_09590, partial [Dehalococcoidales bacterium]
MSKHSKHGRGKHVRKMQRMRQMQPNTGVMQSGASVIPPTSGDISRATAPAAAPKAPTAPVMPQTQAQRRTGAATTAVPLHYEFIVGDLKRIAILTVIVLAIL